MSTRTKLVAFAAALAVVFGGAALAGGAVRRLHAPSATTNAMGMAAEEVRGLAVSDGGLTLDLARQTAPLDERFQLTFRILDSRGRAVRDFDVEHTKRMHFIVVRRDMAGFQHLHPTESSDGRWTIATRLPAAGTYRLFADFSVGGKPFTLADDLQVDGAMISHGLPAAARVTEVDGMRVQLADARIHAGAESPLTFTVSRNGHPVRIEDYLGAKGHLVALRQGDLAYLHVHPDENDLRFMAAFPTAGTYGLFLQFKVGGSVHTAEFTLEVAR